MSAVLPGSAHLVTGHRRSGRWILCAFLVLVVAVAAAGAVAVVSPATAASFAVRPSYLQALRWGAVAVAAGWAAVIASSVFLTRPAGSEGERPAGPHADPPRRGRVLAGAVAAALCAGIAVPAMVLSRYADTTKDVVEDVFREASGRGGVGTAGGPASPEEVFADGRLNLLLVGSDHEPDREGVRADSVILASVDTETGKALLFSLPRNLQHVPFPDGTPMAAAWPDGFDCGNDCLLNAVYNWAEGNAHLFPGDPEPGMTALRATVSETLGIPVDYHVVVSLGGFRDLIDALGGVTIRVVRPLPIGGGTSPVKGYIEPGLRHLDGYHAMWYARSRADSDDYARMDRQRCLLGAIAREADPANVLKNYQQVAASTGDSVDTDIPRDVLPELVKLGFRVKSQPIESITFTPPLIPDTAHPDFGLIRRLVREAIARSEAPPATAQPAPSPEATRPDRPDQPPAADPSDRSPGDTADEDVPREEPVALEDVCSYT